MVVSSDSFVDEVDLSHLQDLGYCPILANYVFKLQSSIKGGIIYLNRFAKFTTDIALCGYLYYSSKLKKKLILAAYAS